MLLIHVDLCFRISIVFGSMSIPFGIFLGLKIGPNSMPKSIQNEVVAAYPHETAPRGPSSRTPPPSRALMSPLGRFGLNRAG